MKKVMIGFTSLLAGDRIYTGIKRSIDHSVFFI